MIDPKELYIGSHVLYNGKRMVVCCISGAVYGADISLIEPKEIVVHKDVWACNIEPIPITAELLEELGFELREDYWRKIFNPNQWIYIRKDDDEDYYNARIHSDINVNTSFRCKYLHELEAFLYLTTKTELIKE